MKSLTIINLTRIYFSPHHPPPPQVPYTQHPALHEKLKKHVLEIANVPNSEGSIFCDNIRKELIAHVRAKRSAVADARRAQQMASEAARVKAAGVSLTSKILAQPLQFGDDDDL